MLYRKCIYLSKQLLSINTTILIVILFVIASTPLAQQINDNQCSNQPGVAVGLVSVDMTAGCSPLKVALRMGRWVLSKADIFMIIRVETPTYSLTSPDTSTNFTYTQSGTHILMQLSESATGQPTCACQTITVQNATPPTLQSNTMCQW
ncbi:MAG: hypothetical protein R2822_06880 [Spirosomataceae bacterium]